MEAMANEGVGASKATVGGSIVDIAGIGIASFDSFGTVHVANEFSASGQQYLNWFAQRIKGSLAISFVELSQ